MADDKKIGRYTDNAIVYGEDKTGASPELRMLRLDSDGYVIISTSTTLNVLDTAPSSLASGSKTVAAAGTAEALATATTCVQVAIQALASNTGNVYVGGSSVAAGAGIALAATQSVVIPIDNLSKVYLDVDNNGEGVSYFYVA